MYIVYIEYILYKNFSLMILNVQCTIYATNAVITMFYRGYSIKILDVPWYVEKRKMYGIHNKKTVSIKYIFSVYGNKFEKN